ncbi:hypothetical protein WG66_013548 [Moniliophthora roreri]|nr:hypothetical protein WG66_013548 [Moniliophthora roreri]
MPKKRKMKSTTQLEALAHGHKFRWNPDKENSDLKPQEPAPYSSCHDSTAVKMMKAMKTTWNTMK